jgi:predicted HTH transcriptional regulator
VTFRQSKEYLKLVEEGKRIEEKLSLLNNREKKAIEFIKQNGRLTMKEYITLFPDVNRKTLTRDLNRVIKLGMVRRKGKGKRDLHYVSA